jgi:hypothetical protein
MNKRLFDSNHEWSVKARELDEHIKKSLTEWVTANPGHDPRDIQLVGIEAVSDLIRWLIVKEMITTAQTQSFDPDEGDD